LIKYWISANVIFYCISRAFLEAACRRSAPGSPVNKASDPNVLEVNTAIERDKNERRSKSQTGAVKENNVFDNNNEKQSNQRKRSSIKVKCDNADRSTDREKRAAEILMKGKRSSRLLGNSARRESPKFVDNKQ
ncbi:hypothetical protein COOONC_15826, partial [Cooperia oncophora]